MKRLALVMLAACGGSGALDRSAPVPTDPPKDAIDKPTEQGPVKVDVRVWPPKPTLDDPIYLRLDVTAPPGIRVDAPFQEAGDQRMGRFRVVGFTRDSERSEGSGQHQVQTYTLEAPSSGKQRIPHLRLEMIDGRASAGKAAGQKQEILTEEIPLDIAPVKEAASNAELHPAAGKLDPDVGGTPWTLVLLGASVLAVLGSGSVLAYRAWRTRRRRAEQKSAYDIAIAKLRALETRGAPAAALADAWFVELSAIVRSYLERRYDIRAPELTTEEFLLEASRARELTTAHRSQLSLFLERCDRVKFAGYRPEAQESIDTLAAARAFIEETRMKEAAAA
ncbi:MAG TPA: hypothetical protein VLX92_18985 [Kofleriaceae bacterium]|nr:hypothetical protein [Kofleriaceae bacterium]